jgi:hypothetical protein
MGMPRAVAADDELRAPRLRAVLHVLGA